MRKFILIFAAALTLFIWNSERPSPPTSTPADNARPKPVKHPEPVQIIEPDEIKHPEIGGAIPKSEPAETLTDLISPIRHQDQDAFIDHALGLLDRIAENPEAAPLLEEIVHFLQADPSGGVRFDDLPVDENGVHTLQGDLHERLFPDPEIRHKWMKLMAIIAADATLYADLTGS